MKTLALVTVAALVLSACDSAPSEESPVNPAVVCDEVNGTTSCQKYDDVVDDEALADGNVLTDVETMGRTPEEPAHMTNGS